MIKFCRNPAIKNSWLCERNKKVIGEIKYVEEFKKYVFIPGLNESFFVEPLNQICFFMERLNG